MFRSSLKHTTIAEIVGAVARCLAELKMLAPLPPPGNVDGHHKRARNFHRGRYL
jgi:hypothetical protein